MQHVEEGRRVLDGIIQTLADVGKIERATAMDGRRMTVILMPAKQPEKAKPKSKTVDSIAAQVGTVSPTRGTIALGQKPVEQEK